MEYAAESRYMADRIKKLEAENSGLRALISDAIVELAASETSARGVSELAEDFRFVRRMLADGSQELQRRAAETLAACDENSKKGEQS